MSDEPIYFKTYNTLAEAKQLLEESPEWPLPNFSEEVGDDGLPLYESYDFGQGAVAMDALRLLKILVAEMNAKNEQIRTLVDFVDKLKHDNQILTNQRDNIRRELEDHIRYGSDFQ